MKRRVLSIFISCCLLLTLAPALTAARAAEEITDDEIVTEVMKWLNIKEGNCNSVNADDNGAVSIGMIQWHGPRALALLKQIAAAVGEERSRDLLGDALYDEIIISKPADWNNRTVNAEEKEHLVAFLSTDESREIQIEMARNDITGYVKHARRKDLTTPALIFYACDIENQYGGGGMETVLNRARTTAGLAENETFHYLYDFHQALLNSTESSYVQNYIARRKATYSYVVNTLKWESLPCTVCFDAAGGEGEVPDDTRVFAGETLTLPKPDLQMTGFALAGWNLTRASDGKWFADDGWYDKAELEKADRAARLFECGETVCFDKVLLSGPAGDVFTFRAAWVRNGFAVDLYRNYSGGNYLLCSDLSTLPAANRLSGGEDYGFALETADTVGRINALRVTAKAAGSAQNAVSMTTALCGSAEDGWLAEDRTLTLTFWARADGPCSLSAAFENGAPETADLTAAWTQYTLTLSKPKTCGSALLLWTNAPAEVLLCQLQLTDGAPGDFLPETGGKDRTVTAEYGKSYDLPTLKRTGYVFNGWYTAAAGGEKITASTKVEPGNRCFYAQWTKQWDCAAYGHEWKYKASAEPTCTAWGTDEYVCIDCGKTEAREVLAPLGHTYGPWDAEQTAACDAMGKRTRTCTVCGASDTELQPATGHVPDELQVQTAPTCRTEGKGTVSCRDCGSLLYETAIPALGHVPGEPTAVRVPTCTEPGRTEVRCTVCGELLSAEIQPAAGHTWTEEVVTSPDENTDGVTKLTCAVCGTVDLRIDPCPAHVHKYTKTTVEPTCEEAGCELYVCLCGDSYRENEVPALGHDAAETAETATCTLPGVTRTVCARCGAVTESDPKPAAGHVMTQLRVLTKPTAAEPGLALYACTVCGWRELRDLPPVEACDGGAACPGAHFTDMPAATNWAHAAIDFCLAEGLFAGTSATTFAPKGYMTRAMLVSVLYRLAAAPATGPDTVWENPFSDVKQTWYTDAVLWATEKGIVSGVGNGKFDPNGNVTREQMAAILYRYTIYKDYDFTAQGDLSVFPDENKISAFAVHALAWANGVGIISGQKTGDKILLNPKGTATRAEVASILMRFVKNVKQS